MFDTLLTITLFLLASLLVCLLTLRLSININFLCLFLHSLPILRDFLKFRPPTPCLLNLTKISDKSLWVKPWLRRRIDLGLYEMLLQELRH